jgi:7-carboxy-7-deazaguanine synthase
MAAVYLSEVFASIEGEGVNTGKPAVFLRLSGCNLSCSFCDTRFAQEREESASVYLDGETLRLSNPVTCEAAVSLVSDSFRGCSTVVLTGGEPLLQPLAVGQISRMLRSIGCRIHLETNGTLATAFRQVKDMMDYVCMDIKIPSTQGGRSLTGEHLDFLQSLGGLDAAAKIVVTEDCDTGEIDDAIDLVAGVNRYLTVILQPAMYGSRPVVTAEQMLAFQSRALERVHDVRILIQLHKVLGTR